MKNIALLHGLWADGSSWEMPVTLLERRHSHSSSAAAILRWGRVDQLKRIIDGQKGSTVRSTIPVAVR